VCLSSSPTPPPPTPLTPQTPTPTPKGDVAASGGYYMSMGASAIVAQPLTITGSIGVVTGKFNLAELYQRAG
jgi:protease-4